MEISPALQSEARVLTQIAFAAKRHWKYPESWIALWHSALTITPAFIAAHETYAARERERIIGCVSLVRDHDTLCLENLWVLPEEIGHGVGRALFRHAQRRAHALGFETIEVESDPNAAGFYKRMGAEQIRTHTTLLEGNPRELPVFRIRTSDVIPAIPRPSP